MARRRYLRSRPCFDFCELNQFTCDVFMIKNYPTTTCPTLRSKLRKLTALRVFDDESSGKRWNKRWKMEIQIFIV